MEDERKEPLKVYLVNPPGENPWRTQQDYLEDQRRAKFQFRLAIAATIISLAGVVATAAVAIESLKRMSASQGSPTQASKPRDPKLHAKAEIQLKKHIENLKSGKSETGILQWGTVRNLRYEITEGGSDGVLSASLFYEQDFSDGTPFVKFSRCELELTFKDGKWWLTGGRHRFFAPEGEKTPVPDWTPYASDNSKGLAMELRMGYWFK